MSDALGQPRAAAPWRRAADAPRALAAAYPERAEATPLWHDRLADALADQLLRPLAHRLWRPASRLARIVPRVAAHAAAAQAAVQAPQGGGIDPTALRRAVASQRAALRRQGLSAEPVAQTLALLREVAVHTLGQRPYDVQLIGAWALLQGRLAEMATGEGKSLTAALAVATAALAGLPVHVVTVNDYLAGRDAAALRPFYDALGLSVGTVVQGQPPAQRRAAYRCDITYCSNKELAFDYLKDRVALARGGGGIPMAVAALAGERQAPLLLRGLHFAVVDEADSVFIDEARTPLILSATQAAADQAVAARRCAVALALAAQLVADLHYRSVAAQRRVTLTAAGEATLAELAPLMAVAPLAPTDDDAAAGADLPAEPAGPDVVWGSARGRRELVEQALSARLHYQRDQHYLVSPDGLVQIVDESTGRVMPDRSWEAGLHQMIEAKEGCALSARRVTLARITYQRLFRRYLRLSGMTGTGREVADELWQVYRLRTVAIPLHRPSARRLLAPRLLPDAAAKWAAVVEVVRQVAVAGGRPVLIGTRSVDASEQLSRVLSAAGLDHALLNARQDGEEAAVIAQAGQRGRVTVATNMAGRGTDIQLGDGVAALGGLHVVLTESHASARIDRQLFGRGARQGDAGSAQMLLAADDELLRTEAGALLHWLRLRWPDAPPAWAIHALCRVAQARSGWRDARQRRATLRLDERLDRLLAFTGTAE